MDKELKIHRPKKGRVSRKRLLLLFICGQVFSLSTFFLVQTNNPELCYVHWRTILNQILFFIRLAVCLIVGYLQSYYRRFGGKRICLYLLFVSVTSYVVVAHCMDSMALFTWDQLKGNVMRRLDDSIIVIDENRNESTSMRQTEEPLVIQEHFRYIDEDVRFGCYHVMSFESEVEPADRQVIWMHNNESLVPSWKFHIDISFIDVNVTHNDSVHSYIINSTLTIYLIEDRDFGNYSCHLRESALKKLRDTKTNNNTKQQRPASRPKTSFVDDIIDCSSFWICTELKYMFEELNEVYEDLQSLLMLQQVLQQNSYQWTGEFKLTKIKKSILTKSAPPGGIISISASYLNLAEKQDISLGYVINTKPFHEVCSGHLNGCSLFVMIYWFFWHAEGHFDVIPRMVAYWLHMSSSILGNAWQCACPSTYGIHVFRFYRHFYNVTSGRNTIIEVEHPQAIRLIPRAADLLLTFQNESTPEPLGEECFNSMPFIRSCSWMECVISELHRNFFWIENLIFALVIMTGVLVAYLFCKPIVRLLLSCASAILDGFDWVEPRETLGSIGHAGLPYKYDVYISHADSQRELASDLASLLESFGKKVFYRERDVAIGDLKIEAVSDAIVSSCKFLIIVSREYIESGFQNRFEFQLILNEIHEGKVNQRNVMLYKHGRCTIPTYFRDFTDMEILDTIGTSAEERFGKLRQWSNCKKNTRSIRLSMFLLFISSVYMGMGLIMPKAFVIFDTVINALAFLWIK
ncbi:uncharacterized protein LOC121381410 [Gigantopelta aegis]|uniref:uncharacterized protein LOC121381410 n=1 Tax=Gigantopelta aegis TaxID=1735272 RepID=UPI001B88C58F|nr:uncharacterized protein LOC121381410 [Gigantopelta aegis]